MQKAIVVGATSGIGKEVALVLAERGWQVGICGRRTTLLKSIAEETENIIGYKELDVTKDDAPTLLREFVEETGGMDLYFHSSGIGWQNPDMNSEKELLTVETNATGFTRMVTAAYRYFEESSRKGHIACISSIAGAKGLGAAPAYSATKRFQNHYLECLEQNARMRGVKVRFTDIRPGFVATNLIAGGSYHMQLTAKETAMEIVHALERKKSIAVIDWKYAILVFFWKLIPRYLWVRMKVISPSSTSRN